MTGAASELRAVADEIIAAGESPRRTARDPVNLPIIENWVEAIGDTNPVWTAGEVAPPAMIQVWTMAGQRALSRDSSDPMGRIVNELDSAGFTSVVATNCDQVYHRYLRLGEQVTITVSLTDLVGPKRTALGEGYFFTTRHTWYAGDEVVGTMDFRILKFRPEPRPAVPSAVPGGLGEPMRPVISADTAFFWAGTAAGELRIQSCADCGTLRHPPGPMCMACGSAEAKYVVAAGAGEVFSFIVHRHPPVPGKKLPMVLALVELPEGVRVLGELVGAAPESVHVGMPVEAAFLRVDDELTLPAWRPCLGGRLPSQLPELIVEATTTFVVGAALATRDFTRVHHDRDFAVASGSKDIFVNILTSTGLVQRFVSDWAGPSAVFRSISIRLGAPCYAGDTLRFTGSVSARDGDVYTVAVNGRDSLGDHVIATVVVEIPGSEA
jgi:uncharacterized OB-fold protein